MTQPVNILGERLNRGLSARDAAKRIGIARETLERAERGLRPTAAIAKRIADFYDVRVTDIWPLDQVAA